MCIYICICIIQCLSVVKTNRFCNVFVQYISSMTISTINRTIAENYVNKSNEKLFFRFCEVIKYGPAYKLL